MTNANAYASAKLDEIRDRIAVLLDRESRYTFTGPKFRPWLRERVSSNNNNHRDSPVSVLRQDELTGQDIRSLICEWMYKVVDHYSLERETIPIAMSYFDRYVAINPRRCNKKDQCQLLALTSLYMAVKLHDTNKEGTITCFSRLSNGRFTPQDIEVQERHLLNDLNWLMNPPTPQSFVYDFVDYLATTVYDKTTQRVMSNIYEVTNYIVEVALFHSPVSQEKASTLAFASFLVALRELKGDIISPEHYEDITSGILSFEFATSDEVATVVCELMDTLKTSNGFADMKYIYKKLDPQSVNDNHD